MTDTTGSAVLFSIRPGYATALVEGVKSAEFRRTRLRRELGIGLIYATSPVMAIIGAFEISDVVEDTPRSVWRRYDGATGIERADFDAYFARSERAVAYEARRTWRFQEPVPLSRIPGIERAPQSMQYLRPDQLQQAFALGRALVEASPTGKRGPTPRSS